MASPSYATDPSRRPPVCVAAPLLRTLLPLSAGVLSAPFSWEVAAALLVLGTTVSRLLACPAWKCVQWLLVGCLLGSLESTPPLPHWSARPAREVSVTLRIEDTFNARRPDHLAGTGILLATTFRDGSLEGKPVAFYLQNTPPGDPARPGDTMLADGVLTYLSHLSKPDDYESYLMRRDIWLTLGQGRINARMEGPGLLERGRQAAFTRAQTALSAGSPDPASPAQVLASIVLGDRSRLTDERLDLYKATGTYHFFAVSGLHVGSVCLCLLFLLRAVRLEGIQAWGPALAGTWMYVWITGSSPSSMRAAIMVSCFMLARNLCRQPHVFPALIASATLVLLWQPSQIEQLGFQLSYSVVAAILLLAMPAMQWRLANDSPAFPGWKGKLILLARKAMRHLRDLFLVSFSASCVSFPLIIEHFQLFTPIGILTGTLVSPLIGCCIFIGVLVLLGTPVSLPLAETLSMASWPLIDLAEFLLRQSLEIPGAVQSLAWPWPLTGTLVTASTLVLAWILQRLKMESRSAPGLLQLTPLALPWLAIACLAEPVP